MNSTRQNIFLELTGIGIRIGIVDSGFNSGKRDIKIGQGIDLTNGQLHKEAIGESDNEFTDLIGHGTACAGIIYKKAPDALIFPIKIFEEELVSDVQQLVSAIEWGIDHKLNILNLSLGTTNDSELDELERVCEKAKENNMFIVAAVSNEGKESYPASFQSVFAVDAGRVRGKYSYFFDPAQSVQFIARGDRQRLDWLDGKQIFMGGTSFAAPHITAIIALLLQKYPNTVFDELCSILEQHSQTERPLLVDGQELYQISSTISGGKRSKVNLSELHNQNDIDWIKKAVIYPFNKEIHSLVRYKEMLPFEIRHVVDVVGKGTIGKDSGEALGVAPNGLIIKKRVEECLEDVDTLVLGFLDEISRIKRKDMLAEMIELALKNNKNVYSLFRVTPEHYPDYFKKFEEKNLHLTSPLVLMEDFEKITKTFDSREPSRVPVVGVFGTSPQQGKFTVQLALRQELINSGYQVGQLGTEQQAALFGFDYSFPNGYDDGHPNLRIPMEGHIQFLQSVMHGIENNNPHIIIVGGQSGIIPYNYAEKSHAYTLSSLIMLMGTVPDAYILLINSIDEFDYIQDNLNVLKGLGKGETILLVFSDKKKEVLNSFGKSSVVQKPLTKDEIADTIKKFEDRFGIPTTEAISPEGRQKMLTAVENYFTTE